MTSRSQRNIPHCLLLLPIQRTAAETSDRASLLSANEDVVATLVLVSVSRLNVNIVKAGIGTALSNTNG